MFEILDTPLPSLIIRLICLIIAGGSLFYFIKRAIDQLKSAKTITAIVDEIIISFAIIVGVLIVISIPPSQILQFFVKPVIWVWNSLIELLRLIGFPI